MQDTRLRKYLGISKWRINDFKEYKETPILKKIEDRLNSIFRNNYFAKCPCCNGKEEVFISDAKSFRKLHSGDGCYPSYNENLYVSTEYTTIDSYEIHKKAIDEWEKEVKEHLKK